MPYLKVVSPKAALYLDFDRAITIGRHISNSVPVPDREVSRRHAQIFPREGRFHVADLGSRNGVFVNGEKKKEGALRAGDEIALGMTLIFYDPPEETDLKDLLSARGAQIWKKIPREKQFLPFEITTCSRVELDELLGKWLGHGSAPLPMSQSPTSRFLGFVLASDQWATRGQLYTGTLEFLRERIGGDRLAITRADPKKKDLQVLALLKGADSKDFDIAKDVLRVAVEGERAVFCPDCKADFRFERIGKQGKGVVGSFLAVPIFSKDTYYGFLYADQPPGGARYDFKCLVQAYLLGSLFSRCVHWLQLGRARQRE